MSLTRNRSFEMASIIGTQSTDNLADTADSDAVLALGGNDTITASGGRDVVDGGAGTDRLVVNYGMATARIANNGENAIDNPTGNAADAVTFDDVESFSVTTGSGDDTIRTFVRDDISDTNNSTVISGNDFISSGDGNDQIAGGAGNDELRGGNGNDVVDGDGSLRGKFGGTLGDIEFIGDDLLFGEAGNDSLYGGNGSDILDGGTGDDELYGDRIAFRATDGSAIGGPSVQIQMSTGNDMLSGNDMLDGGEGNDILVGNAGDDTILGGIGNDTARTTVTSDGADRVDLGAGDDVVAVMANADANVSSRIRLTFTSAEIGNGLANDANTMANQDGGLAVRLQSEDYADGLVGPVSRYDDEGITFVASNESAPQVTFDVRDLVSGVSRGDLFEVVTLGTSGADVQTAVLAARPYYFNAGMGDDQVTGGAGNDFLVGGAGNDMLDGGAGNDSFLGGAGADSLTGGIGNDMLAGGTEDDTLDGGSGDDMLIGDAGSDRLSGGTGADALNGGADFDYAFYRSSTTGVDARLYDSALNSGDATGDVFTSIEGLAGSAFGDMLFGDGSVNVLSGEGGDDTMDGVGGLLDQYFGGAGTDQIYARQGADIIDGGDGIDYARYDYADTGVRAYLYDATQNFGHAALDSYVSVEGLVGSGFGDDLRGNSEINVLYGDDGDDFFIGFEGTDVLNGGADVDTFFYATAFDGGGTGDSIQDFVSGTDRIMVQGSNFGLGSQGGTAIDPTMFVAGMNATMATVQFGFDNATGEVWYDFNGTSDGGRVTLAYLQTGATLVSTDILVL
jgi:Ca2+-binding RTX toxin-like protein